MGDPWSWPNGIIPNTLAALATGLVLLVTWFRRRHQIRRWLNPVLPASPYGARPDRRHWVRQGLKLAALLLLASLLVFFVFTSALIVMLPLYALEAILNTKH